ncbi:MAG: rhodanese-like domain-containing protein [Deltaproteobacteria bacterium]|nr:rhodanese-like domain-containing protein [Deltaproteobacteria bacterium]
MVYTNITPREAYAKIEKEGFAYLDVRTEEEFNQGRAKGSVNIPIFINTPEGRGLNANFVKQVQAKFDPSTKLVIGCHAGGRSAKACQLLTEKGYKNIFNIDGGFGGRVDPQTGETIKGWEEEGLPCG